MNYKTLNDSVVCRQCGSHELRNTGPIPRGQKFAGQALSPPWAGGYLYICNECHLVFRHPLQSDQIVEALYDSASDEVWVSHDLRRDQVLVKQQIEHRFTEGSILDVGCYDGAFLNALGSGYCKYGIEASQAAGLIAEKVGVKILGARFSDLASIGEQFDIICAIDIIEHVRDPFSLLRDLKDRIHDDGVIIISTGNPDSFAWKVLGSRFWYCTIPEHISFITKTWALRSAEELGLVLTETIYFRHSNAQHSGIFRFWHSIKFLMKLFLSFFEMNLIRPFSHKSCSIGPRIFLGIPGIFEDHELLVFTKTPKNTTSTCVNLVQPCTKGNDI